MVDFHESSQLCSWTYTSPVHLTWLRGKANYLARQQLAIADANTAGQHGGVEKNKSAEDNHNDDRKNNTNNNNNNGGGNTVEDGNGAVTDTTKTITAAVLSSGLPNPTQAKFFARGWTKRFRSGRDDGETTAEDEEYQRYETSGPRENGEGRSFLTSAEETCLVSFYAPKIGKMIGPRAVLPRLKRNSKVTATAALLYRRFFLSNSVMMYDPKAVMVASAFLASKVEDASVDVRYLEEGTQLFNAHVSQEEIIAAELALIQGVAFDLLCFHPHKAVLALTEDLRTFLKSDRGKVLVVQQQQQQHNHHQNNNNNNDDLQRQQGTDANRTVSGQDLEPLYARARDTLEEALLRTDLALLYTPGQLGLASLMAAQDILHEQQQRQQHDGTSEDPSSPSSTALLQIDWHGYVMHRFDTPDADTKEKTWEALQTLRRELREAPNKTVVADKKTMVSIFKKLKKVRAWGSNNNNTESNKKRKKEEDGKAESPASPQGEEERSKKRVKAE